MSFEDYQKLYAKPTIPLAGDAKLDSMLHACGMVLHNKTYWTAPEKYFAWFAAVRPIFSSDVGYDGLDLHGRMLDYFQKKRSQGRTEKPTNVLEMRVVRLSQVA